MFQKVAWNTKFNLSGKEKKISPLCVLKGSKPYFANFIIKKQKKNVHM